MTMYLVFIQHTTSLYQRSNRNCRIVARAITHQTPRAEALLDQNIVYFGLYLDKAEVVDAQIVKDEKRGA
jgi:hypothetical protein